MTDRTEFEPQLREQIAQLVHAAVLLRWSDEKGAALLSGLIRDLAFDPGPVVAAPPPAPTKEGDPDA